MKNLFLILLSFVIVFSLSRCKKETENPISEVPYFTGTYNDTAWSAIALIYNINQTENMVSLKAIKDGYEITTINFLNNSNTEKFTINDSTYFITINIPQYGTYNTDTGYISFTEFSDKKISGTFECIATRPGTNIDSTLIEIKNGKFLYVF